MKERVGGHNIFPFGADCKAHIAGSYSHPRVWQQEAVGLPCLEFSAMKYLWELVRRCPYCGSSSVRRSKRQDLFEAIALPLLLLRPYRCQACDLRHYSFVFTKRDQSTSMQGNRH